jgi:hypothetical protein
LALKKLRVSFDIDIPVFLQMVAAGNCAMKIDVFGDGAHAKPPKLLNGHAPKLLEGPKTRRSRGDRPSNYAVLLALLAQHKDRAVKVDVLKQAVVDNGGAPNSSSPQLAKLRADGFVKKTVDGYQITPRGLARHAKTTAPAQATAEA